MEEALKQISNLVERFERNIDAYHSPAYNETQLRREFYLTISTVWILILRRLK